ncbi:hypothetical protein [Microvirga puerhi]|uniref:Uncharacterized protein n=1 Tax=Microvirga puerhi TaxID=2876078 RepID=A0ABS7VW76_9HYPH|nr:hypothetical protein [Microvirga puerhi]MBZ6079118.1 hypothetical protein [Microvirga puerhi]
MAHREQHGNRESKKPAKERPKDNLHGESKRWAVSEAFQEKAKPKH